MQPWVNAMGDLNEGVMEQGDSNTFQVGTILLAAGGSSRLGRPKQLLQVQGQSLVQHSVATATNAGLGPVIVVLGASAAAIAKEVQHPGVHTVVNEAWQEGMAASIRCGLAHLQQLAPKVTAVILMVCDQPYVSADLLKNLVAAHHQTGKPVVTCSYGDTFGPPTLFQKTLFPHLLRLAGDVGARAILREHADDVAAIPFAEGVVDIDTERDYQQVTKDKPAA